jgi:hypothetical protein
MASAPDDRCVLVDFKGSGPIVAFRDKKRPDQWVRYLGFGKSAYWPSIHEDYAIRWIDIPA